MEIPEPVSESEFSGRFLLRLPPRLHRSLHERSRSASLSMNQYIRTALEKEVDNRQLLAEIKAELKASEHRILEGRRCLTSTKRKTHRETIY
ncbi:MAG: toxin-antitoxin system HicB family antitoxin [Pseudomonadota bacterium]